LCFSFARRRSKFHRSVSEEPRLVISWIEWTLKVREARIPKHEMPPQAATRRVA
jgi:hypothetical protein